MQENQICKNFIKANWLVLLIAAQPLLDALAYWTRNSIATAAGFIRLAVMVILPLYLLFTLKRKRGFLISMCVIGAFCAAHILNCLRVGYISPFNDIEYMARIAQMPVLAICFVFLICNEQTKEQALRGIGFSGVLTVACLALALITGTWNSTYGGGLGISGWVIDDNRCANSIIFVTLAVFAVLTAAKSDKLAAQIGLPALTALILVANSTKACYLGLFCIFIGFIVFMLLRRRVTGDRVKKAFVITLAVLAIVAAAVYPITPRARVDSAQSAAAVRSQNEFDEKVAAMGFDLDAMTTEEKLAEPELRAAYEEYYQSMIGAVIPEMFTRFSTDRVLVKYGMTTSATKLIDVRLMKTNYAALIWDDCDGLTKLVGFEPSSQSLDGRYDMENDWHALFYYCGYLGFALYVLFILYFVYLVIKRLAADFKGSFTAENFALGICLVLQLGLAQFSGAILRRPNVSIYLALVLGMIYYKTVTLPVAGNRGLGE